MELGQPDEDDVNDVEASQPDKLEEIAAMMTTVENLKTTVAAWDVTNLMQTYSSGIKDDIGNFVLDAALFYTTLEAVIRTGEYIGMTILAAKLKELECRWATLKEAVKFFRIDRGSDYDDGGGEPSDNRHRV